MKTSPHGSVGSIPKGKAGPHGSVGDVSKKDRSAGGGDTMPMRGKCPHMDGGSDKGNKMQKPKCYAQGPQKMK